MTLRVKNVVVWRVMRGLMHLHRERYLMSNARAMEFAKDKCFSDVPPILEVMKVGASREFKIKQRVFEEGYVFAKLSLKVYINE